MKWENEYENPNKYMNFVEEITDLHFSIILACTFGIQSQHGVIK